MYRVLKELKTPLHRFPAGAEIAAADIDGPLSADDWMALGYLDHPAVAALADTPSDPGPSEPAPPANG